MKNEKPWESLLFFIQHDTVEWLGRRQKHACTVSSERGYSILSLTARSYFPVPCRLGYRPPAPGPDTFSTRHPSEHGRPAHTALPFYWTPQASHCSERTTATGSWICSKYAQTHFFSLVRLFPHLAYIPTAKCLPSNHYYYLIILKLEDEKVDICAVAKNK